MRQWILEGRKKFFSPEMDDPEIPENYADDDGRHEVETLEEANLVSSKTLEGPYDFMNISMEAEHLPVLDIDFEAELVPSTTPGHWHLYLQRRLPWSDYVKLLDVMLEVGLLEPGFVKLSKERGATFVRKPGHKKVRKTR